DARDPGIADRPGRQAAPAVGVVRAVEVGVPEGYVRLVPAERVENGRVDLKRHILAQAVVDDGGDLVPVAGHARFTLDQRGNDDRLVERPPRGADGARVLALYTALEVRGHRLDD